MSEVLQVKDGLDRTGIKIDKNGKNFMHWKVSLDALPRYARLVRVWTAGLKTEYISLDAKT